MKPVCRELAKIPVWVWYVLIVSGAILSYAPAKALLTTQDATVTVIKSPITVNFVLFLFLWGLVADKIAKGMSRRKGWLLWLAGFAAIILAYRFIGGYETLFG